MNSTVKKKLIVKPLIAIAICSLLAIFIIFFIPHQLSKLPILNGNEIQFPAYLGYIVVFGFVFKPLLNLIENLVLINKCEKGQNPPCPICSYPMVKRMAKKGKFIGQEFWGCLTFPKCSGKIHIG